MKSLVQQIFSEYSDAEKKELGIPPNAISKGGKWYVGDTYVGRVIKGKFKSVQQPKKTITPIKSKPKKKSPEKKKERSFNDIVNKVKNVRTKIARAAETYMKKKKISGISIQYELPEKQFLAITGLSEDEYLRLIKTYGSYEAGFLLSTVMGVDDDDIQIKHWFWEKLKPTKTDTPTEPIKPIKLDGITTRPPVDLDDHPKKYAEEKVLQDAKIERKTPKDPALDPEAKAHDRIIRQDWRLDATVDAWTQNSIWGESASSRHTTFNLINNVIDKNDMRVKSKTPLYRGMHFESSTKKFAKELMTKFTQGNEIQLPPAGFSLDSTYALDFAQVGKMALSVFMILQQKETGVRGMHVWKSGQFHKEREVITRGSSYKVISNTLQQFHNAGGGGSGQTAIHLTITLEQMDKLKEEVTESDVGIQLGENESIIDFLFGDSMKHTAKNLKKLSGKHTKSSE